MGHHHQGHGHIHRSVRLTSPIDLERLRTPVHRIGRRQFLTELGRGTFAVAILGGVAAACAGDSSDPSATVAPSTPASSSPAPSSTAAAASSAPAVTEPSADAADGDDAAEAPEVLRWSQVSLGGVSAYVLVRGNEAAVVDTGNPGSVEQIGNALGTLGVNYDDVRHVVLTHHHPDHIGSLPEVLDRAGSADAYAGGADIPNIVAPVDVRAVGDGDDVFGLQVIDTPGHTPGSISVLDTGIGLLIAGDALNGNADGTGISGADQRYTADMGVAGESIRKLATFDFDTAAFGHGNLVTTGAGPLVDALVDSL